MLLAMNAASAQLTTLPVKNANGASVPLGTLADNAGTNYYVMTVGNLIGGVMTTAPVSATLGLSVNVTNSGLLSQGSTTSGQSGLLGFGAVTTAAPAYTTGQSAPFSLDTAGNLRSNVITSVLPTGASTSSNQTSGAQKTQVVDGSGNVIASTSNNLNVQCANCSGSGVSAGDEASYTAGASVFAASGGFFQTTATNNALTSGQQGMAQMTAQRAQFVNLRDASGNEEGKSTQPLQVSLANTAANATAVTVSGTITSTQATGSNLHVVSDSGSTVQLGTGANIAGKFTTDQTTPGTTDLVHDKPAQKTIVALDISTVTTGGTAVTALSAGHRTGGGWIQNPPTATIALCINEAGTASGTTSSGSTTCILPGITYTLIPAAGAVSVISSDSSHAFSGYGLQ